MLACECVHVCHMQHVYTFFGVNACVLCSCVQDLTQTCAGVRACACVCVCVCVCVRLCLSMHGIACEFMLPFKR